MTSPGWYGPALDNHAPSDAGAHLGPVTIGVLHTTESPRGSFRPDDDSYFGHQSYPHFTVDVQDGEFRCWQHISIRRCAKALKNLKGGVETNREGVIQIEVVGRASEPFTSNAVLVRGLAKLMRWIESETDIPRSSAVDFHPYPPDLGARLGREPWRMSNDAWSRYAGWLGHQHSPENAHGDPGAIDIAKLLALPAPPAARPTPLEDDVKLYVFTDKGLDWGTDLLTKRRFDSQDDKKAWVELVTRLGGTVTRVTLTSAEAAALVEA